MKKKSLNEEISRIKNMMGKIINEKYDDKKILNEIANSHMIDEIEEEVEQLFDDMIHVKLDVKKGTIFPDYGSSEYDNEGRLIHRKKGINAHLEDKYNEMLEKFDLRSVIDDAYNLVKNDYELYERKNWNGRAPRESIEYAKNKIIEFLESY